MWTLFNQFITMFHNDDLLHRIFYVIHIFTVFITAYYVTNHETETFSIAMSGEGMCWGSLTARIVLGIMFTWAAVNHEGGQFRKEMYVHAAVIFTSAVLFCISLVVYKSECNEVFHAECKGNGNIKAQFPTYARSFTNTAKLYVPSKL